MGAYGREELDETEAESRVIFSFFRAGSGKHHR
jgi:hypothetical protein